MAEQITHKKSLKRVDNEKRRLLKEYYNLRRDNGTDTAAGDAENAGNDTDASVAGASAPAPAASDREVSPQDVVQEIRLELEQGNIDVKSKSLKQLLQVQNLLLAEETEADNVIKNTIYDNYYDLIKVDGILKEMGELDESLVAQLRETCDMAQCVLKQ
ncbi:unnamed protein product [Kluyveromyces dobzhanskii CBS 2104]|uniref:WGS project CCBQ000000000 data, contig 00098 n=1 Tax=Kluyveromyces dobzhanskii CBS 2104 TaxID=1427455 RepID=A0A0A8L353_9SACH|nr:unnamed protein product [Kluyveromyces dobzhanskii CBS 2104]